MKPIPDYGHHMTMKEFVASCKCGGFTNHDGFGLYATECGMTDIDVQPSDIVNDTYIKSYSHVVWFNR